jgi:hypothetical protein
VGRRCGDVGDPPRRRRPAPPPPPPRRPGRRPGGRRPRGPRRLPGRARHGAEVGDPPPGRERGQRPQRGGHRGRVRRCTRRSARRAHPGPPERHAPRRRGGALSPAATPSNGAPATRAAPAAARALPTWWAPRTARRTRCCAPRRAHREGGLQPVVESHVRGRPGRRWRRSRTAGRGRSWPAAIAATRASSALSTAVPDPGSDTTSSALARATSSIVPNVSVCSGGDGRDHTDGGTGDRAQLADVAGPPRTHLHDHDLGVIGCVDQA